MEITDFGGLRPSQSTECGEVFVSGDRLRSPLAILGPLVAYWGFSRPLILAFWHRKLLVSIVSMCINSWALA